MGLYTVIITCFGWFPLRTRLVFVVAKDFVVLMFVFEGC